jgi:hypothetical protein
MWTAIHKEVPKAKCFQIIGNHDVRLSKRIGDKFPELAEVFDPMTLYQFEGDTTAKSDRDFYTIDGVVYCHGWLSSSLAHAKYFNKPCVHGHRHRATIETEGNLWSLDVGHCADENSLPLSYTASKHSKWTVGLGLVINGNQPVLLLPKLIIK